MGMEPAHRQHRNAEPPPPAAPPRSRLALLAALGLPIAMIATGLALVAPVLWRGIASAVPTTGRAEAPSTHVDAVRGVAPSTPWRTLPTETTLTRIGFGSCLHQSHPQPIWRAILAARPELFVMMGDNVYGDIKSADARELADAYRRQLAHPEFSAARAALPMLGTWDDHDYGQNDGSAAFPQRAEAAALFRAYWQRPPVRDPAAGVNDARIYGREGRRVQIILLDTRSFRSPFALKQQATALPGKYRPDSDPRKTMLGEAQWRWLEGELRKPAEIRLIVSSIQVLSEGHAFESWRLLPGERERLLRTIQEAGAGGTILLSGDRHVGAIYNRSIAAGQILIEITSSSLNRSYGPAKDEWTAELVSDLHHAENFGLIDIDWTGGRVTLSLRGMGGEELDGLSAGFADLGLGR